MTKTILITGSTDGIGKLTAEKLAQEGHEVYLHGRNQEKLAKVVEELQKQSNNKKIKGFVADFSDLDAVRKMADQVNKELSKLDVLINNAGVYKSPVSQNKDGLDIRFVVNYLAPYLLTKTFGPLLEKSNEARVINLSSAAQDSVSLDALAGNSTLSMREAYAQSKLALTMWSFYLARTRPDMAVIAVNPGSLLNTNMVREAFGRSWSSPDKGANILHDLAVKEEYQDVTGKYFDNDRGGFGDAHPDAYNEGEIEHLIELTEKLISD